MSRSAEWRWALAPRHELSLTESKPKAILGLCLPRVAVDVSGQVDIPTIRPESSYRQRQPAKNGNALAPAGRGYGSVPGVYAPLPAVF